MKIRSTTILAVRRNGIVAMGSDGQVTVGTTVMKANARKVRRLYHDKILAGFAGATADAFTLFEKFDVKLEEYRGNLTRAAVELAKDWRTDRVLRRLLFLQPFVRTLAFHRGAYAACIDTIWAISHTHKVLYHQRARSKLSLLERDEHTEFEL